MRPIVKLRNYISDTGMTQAQVAARLGISLRYLGKLMRGERKPTLAMAFRIYRGTRGRVGMEDWFPVASEQASARADIRQDP
jgi:transcriptional regulator with XRE-family HTH domain